MADELRAGPGPKTNFLDDFSGMFRNKLAGPSYFDDASALVNRLMSKPSASQNLAAWEYNKTPPMPNEGQTNMLGKLLSMVPENAMFAANFLVPGVKPTMPAPKPQGIRAYHGSPHDFDKFSLKHIGKGEGAQAYGHGLYFAENEGVARSYRDTLAHKGATPEVMQGMRDRLGVTDNDLSGLIYTLANGSDDPIKAAASVQMRAPHLRDDGPFSAIGPKRKAIANEIASIRDATRGRMYEVNIKADPSHFMDLDAPIAKQPEAVRRVIEGELKAGSVDPTRDQFRSLLGQPPVPAPDLNAITPHDYLRSRIKPGRLEDALRAEGVPGAKYLDQGSRVAGEGSRNYVVFDDKLIEILRKYGLMPPAVAAGAAAMGQGDQQ